MIKPDHENTNRKLKTILIPIARLQPQLVLMGTYNRPTLNRLAHGSVSHTTVHHAPCSVLLLKGRFDVPTT